MTSRHRRLLVLLLSALVACGRARPPAETVEPAPTTTFAPSQLDPTKRPCDDFAGYVNDEWLAANPVPPDRTSWGSFEILAARSELAGREIAEAAAANPRATGIDKAIGDFWRSGMDTRAIEAAGVTPIRPILDRIDALATPDDVVRYLREEFAAGRGEVFSFGPQADMKQASMVIAYASQSGLGLPERAYYLEDGKDGAFAKIRAAYVAHLGRQLRNAGVPQADAERQAADTLAFETRLATASLAPVDLRNPLNRYHWVTVAEADRVTPRFSWSEFLRSQGLAVRGFSLSQPKFFAEVDAMLAGVPVAQWQSYLRAHAIDGMAPYLSDPFAAELFDFYGKTLRGQAQQKPRWKRVLGTIEGQIGEALGQRYVERWFPPASKVAMEALVANLRAALKARLERLDWMSAKTKRRALEKWKSFVPKIGYPDKWRSWEGLVTSPDSYVGNVLAGAKFDHEWEMGKIGLPVDRTEWSMTPQTVNAYYNPQRNEIVFPAAILQPPFFDPNADPALNYGGIGAVIGHEMLHGYDDQGSRFDAAGNLVDWWQMADRKGFEARTAKLVRQFDDYVSIDDIHVNGKLTLGENIADLGGLTVSWDAYRKALADAGQAPSETVDGFTRDQRFFLNWATVWRRNYKPEDLRVRLRVDPHAPANFRAIGGPSNLPSFAASFGCSPGDAMVRDGAERVVIW